jgi:D-alanine-D-alanine ligase
MQRQRIGVLMGGTSAERDVSFRSGAAVVLALEDAGHDVVRLELGPGVDPLWLITEAKIEVAFLALHGRHGEDGCIQGLLELLGIPYTGSDVLASALAMDKLKSKELFRLHNVPTPPYYEFRSDYSLSELEDLHRGFGFPVMVKPRREGSSIGIHQAGDLEELRTALQQARRYDGSVLVERFVSGQEVTVGILNGRVLGVLEVVPKSGSYDFAAKYTPGMTEYFMPARLTEARCRGVLHLAERACQALGTRGAARVDVIVTQGMNEYVLEVNTLPGMTPTSLLPKIAAAAGYSFRDLCEAIVASAGLYASMPSEVAESATVTRTQRSGAEAADGQALKVAV